MKNRSFSLVANINPKMHSTPMKTELENFENWLVRLGYAESTIKGYVRLLANFFKYLNQESPHKKR